MNIRNRRYQRQWRSLSTTMTTANGGSTVCCCIESTATNWNWKRNTNMTMYNESENDNTAVAVIITQWHQLKNENDDMSPILVNVCHTAVVRGRKYNIRSWRDLERGPNVFSFLAPRKSETRINTYKHVSLYHHITGKHTNNSTQNQYGVST